MPSACPSASPQTSRLIAAAVALWALAGLAAAPGFGEVPNSPPVGGEQAEAASLILYDFEGSAEGWRPLEGEGAPRSGCAASGEFHIAGAQSLKIASNLPGPAGACISLPSEERNWHRFTHLLLSVYTPQDAPRKVQLIVYLKDTDLYYYQHVRKNYLRRGHWTHLRMDLTANSDWWQFKGHYKPWDGYCRQDVQELGVKFICEEQYQGSFYLDRVELRRDPAALPGSNAIYNLRANSAVVRRHEKFELSFNLARTYSNPFDPDVVDVRGYFVRPDGTEVEVPGFFYQGYLRRMDKGREELIPMGRSQWKVRFAPMQAGAYRYWVEVRDADPIRSEMGRFRCVEGEGRGFVRISAQDPDYFEFDDGAFFFPLGHNIAAVHDARAEVLQVNIPASEGTYAYDRILGRMAEAGENFGRIWMSPWSFGLEWTKAYDVHYRGLGRYNLLNAWRLDHVLRAAEQNGVYAMLLFTAHGEIGDYESDFQGHDREKKQGSPYWSRYGGPVDHPKEIYTSEEVLELYKQKARYIVARWGYCSAVMAWEILNEPDLAAFYKENQTYQGQTYGELGARFVQNVARHIRALDPAEHLITSGCYRYRKACAEPTLRLEEVDFNTGHVFEQDLESRLLSDLRYMQGTFNKIFLVTEAGLTPFAQDAETTALAIHRTLWSSFMTPGAGVAAPWWWVLIDRRDLYGYFRALRNFAEGEDRRGRNYDAGVGSARDEAGKRSLKAVVLTNGQRAFGWIYHPASFTSRATWEEAPEAPAAVTINGLKAGPYRIEVWDTYRGEVIGRLEAESRQTDGGAGGTALTFNTPPFARDVACKVLPK